MFLNEIFKRKVVEGGNLSLDNPNDANTPYQADEIDLKVHNRTFMVGLLDKLLHDVNSAFYAQAKKPLWNPQLLQSKEFLGGSSIHFFNTKGISDKEFAKHKPKVGDVDTQCNKELEPELQAFLTSMDHKQIGDATLLGFSSGNEQYNALFQFQDPPIKVQIDFEFGKYDAQTDSPDEWFRFSHSSEWNDIQAGIKGVFHKYIYRALTSAHGSIKHQVDVKKTKTNIVPNVDDNDLSFSVASGQGGGLSQKYEPYIHTDPATGEKKTHDQNIPYKKVIQPAQRTYIQKLDQQFYYFFGKQPEGNDSQLQKSFLGTLELINKYIDPAVKDKVFQSFIEICFEPGAQMITKDDPKRDGETKFAAIDKFIEECGLKHLRKFAVDKATHYEQDFLDLKSFKEKNPPAPGGKKPMYGKLRKDAIAAGQWKPLAESILREADEQPAVKAQLRKGMPHLHDLKSADFLDLLDELHDGNGNFKLENIPLNVKVDGFGGRFGKNAEGKPFMGTSRTEPRYEAGFLAYHQKKGTEDPEILGRAKVFDDLFKEIMNAIKLVDSKLGPDFLINKQVTCEVLFIPFATETDEGKLKFVGIHYDKLPQGVQLALVPFHAVEADSGDPVEDPEFIDKLLEVGQQGSVMFVNNRLVQKEGLDVTALVPPLENIEQFKAMLASKKRDQAAEVKAALEPVKVALEKAIINDPNIIGKDMLGKDYEGIVINSRLGPIKVTSQEQRDVITAKNAAKASARTERPRGDQKSVAVVAIGSAIGHIGHQQLFDLAVKKANETGGDPYFFIGNAEGKDDPIPVPDKVKTWHLLYPQYAKNIGAVTMEGGSLLQKVKHELINPLPGKSPRYSTIYIVVGKDREKMANDMSAALMKGVNKFEGYEHVKVIPFVTGRSEDEGGTGVSGTALRNAIKTKSSEEAFATWSHAFNTGHFGATPLPAEWIKHLMDVARKNMGIPNVTTPTPVNKQEQPAMATPQQQQKQALQKEPQLQQEPMAEYKRPVGRLFNEMIGSRTSLTEAMLPKKAFAGATKNKLGTAGQARGEPKRSQKAPLKGLMVGETNITPSTIHSLADKKGVKWDNEPSFLKLTKRLTGLEHLDDLDQAGLQKVKQHLEKQSVEESWKTKAAGAALAASSLLGNPAHAGRVKSTNEAKRAERPLPNTSLKVGDRVVADLRKEKNYPTDQQYVSGFVTRIGEKGVHIDPDGGGDVEWHPYKIVKKLGEAKQRLDPKCWKGYKKAGTKMKGGVRVNNCVPVSEDVESVIGSLIETLMRK